MKPQDKSIGTPKPRPQLIAALSGPAPRSSPSTRLDRPAEISVKSKKANRSSSDSEPSSTSHTPSAKRPVAGAKENKTKASPGQSAREMTLPRKPKGDVIVQTMEERWDEVKSKAGASVAKADAVCMSAYIYDLHEGKGALKYQPIKCSTINMKAGGIDLVLKKRRPKLHYTLTQYLPPGHVPGKKKRKALVTLDTGLRLGVTTGDAFIINQLLWSDRSDDRVKFLLVPDCEAQDYLDLLGDKLKAVGVGLVGWDNEIVVEPREGASDGSSSSSSASSDEEPPMRSVYGFGASRRAAQLLIQTLSEGDKSEAIRADRMVMVDGNVKLSTKLIDGYETDNEPEYKIGQNKAITTSSGWGSGTPKYAANGESIKSQGGRRTGEGGTLEQVVTVGFGMAYDIAFVGGGEDIDLTDRSLQVLNLGLSGDAQRKMCSLRAENTIEKFDLGTERCSKYRTKLNLYKKQLAEYEGKMLKLAYRPWAKGAKGKDCVKCGDLATFAKFVADWNGKACDEISCLMMEVILRQAREQLKDKWRATEGTETVKFVKLDTDAPLLPPVARREVGPIKISAVRKKKAAQAPKGAKQAKKTPKKAAEPKKASEKIVAKRPGAGKAGAGEKRKKKAPDRKNRKNSVRDSEAAPSSASKKRKRDEKAPLEQKKRKLADTREETASGSTAVRKRKQTPTAQRKGDKSADNSSESGQTPKRKKPKRAKASGQADSTHKDADMESS